MRYLICLIFLVCIQLYANAQNLKSDWVTDLGGKSGLCQVTAVGVDKQNNVYITGRFSSDTIDFDPGPRVKYLETDGNDDVFVAKYQENGSLIWAESFPSTNNGTGSGLARPAGIAVDKDGNVSITGEFGGETLNADPGGIYNLTAVGEDGFLIHLDTDGNFLWAYSTGGNSLYGGEQVASDSQDNVVGTSTFGSTITVGDSTYTVPSGRYDGLIVKYNAAGAVVWSICLRSSPAANQAPHGCTVDSQGNIIVSGTFNNTVNFNPLGTAYNVTATINNESFLAAYSASGILKWISIINTTLLNLYEPSFSRVGVDQQNNVLFMTEFAQSITFDSGATINAKGIQDICFAKYSSSGVLQFSKTIGGPSSYASCFDIASDQSNHIYLAGDFGGTINFNPGSGTAVNLSDPLQGTEFYAAEYDPNGNYVFAFSSANPSCGNSVGFGLAIDGDNNLDFGGEFCSSVNFDPSGCSTDTVTSISRQLQDGFIAQYRAVTITNNVITPPAEASFCMVGSPGAIAGSLPSDGSGVFTYQWQSSTDSVTFVNVAGATGQNYIPDTLKSTTYFERIVSSGTCTTPVTSNVVKLTLGAPPAAPQVAPASACAGGTTTLTITSPVAGATYNWYANPTTDSILFAGTSFVTPALTSAATYYVTAVNSTGCTSTRSPVNVAVNAAPQVSSQNTTICSGSTASLTASVTDTTAVVTWYATATGGNVLATGTSYTTSVLDSTTTYYLQATGNTGCTSPARTMVTVTILPPLAPPIVMVDSTTVTGVTFLWAAVTGATGYQVSIDGGLTFTAPTSGSDGLSTTISGLQPAQAVALIVEATGNQACETSAASAAITGTTLSTDVVYVPNAFTPNGDGRNDVVHVHGDAIKTMSLYIYDQWGELLFTATDIQNGWDGTFKGKREPVGVYVYYLRAVMDDGQIINKKGTITLIK